MARPIKNTPILTGQDATDFILLAEQPKDENKCANERQRIQENVNRLKTLIASLWVLSTNIIEAAKFYIDNGFSFMGNAEKTRYEKSSKDTQDTFAMYFDLYNITTNH